MRGLILALAFALGASLVSAQDFAASPIRIRICEGSNIVDWGSSMTQVLKFARSAGLKYLSTETDGMLEHVQYGGGDSLYLFSMSKNKLVSYTYVKQFPTVAEASRFASLHMLYYIKSGDKIDPDAGDERSVLVTCGRDEFKAIVAVEKSTVRVQVLHNSLIREMLTTK